MTESRFAPRDLKMKMLQFIGSRPENVNRLNMLGKALGVGTFEQWAGIRFTPEERAVAYDLLDELRASRHVMPTYSQLGPDAEDWYVLTERGKKAVERGDLDELDRRLRELSPELIDRRNSAWSVFHSGEPQATRQAAMAARELLKCVIDTLGGTGTLRDRIRAAYLRHGPSPSQTEGEYIEAEVSKTYQLNELLSSAGKSGPLLTVAQTERTLRSTEDALRWILGITEE
jgi:hypothetical protein